MQLSYPSNYFCSCCNFSYHDINEIKNHSSEKSHRKNIIPIYADFIGIGDYSCPCCYYCFETEEVLNHHFKSEIHIRRSKSTSRNIFHCVPCKVSFITISDLEKHVNESLYHIMQKIPYAIVTNEKKIILGQVKITI